jgi:thymidylate kinase
MVRTVENHPAGTPEPIPALVPSLREPACTDFLLALLRALEDHGIRYCVLDSCESLPEEGRSDLAIHPQDRARLPRVFRTLGDQGYRPLQCLEHAANSFSIVFFWLERLEPIILAVDIIFEHHEGGLTLTSGEAMVTGRRRHGAFWILGPEAEFRYLLGKQILKGSLPERQALRLSELARELGPAVAESVAGGLVGQQCKKQVVDACTNGSVEDLRGKLSIQLWLTTLGSDPLNPIRNLLGDISRHVRNFLQPAGLFLVILGPDGVGKSTLVGKLIEKLGPAFRCHRVFHWRPQLIVARKGDGKPVTAPHGAPPRGVLGSVAKLLVFFLDYWLGYLLVIRPFLTRPGLVAFDRYFHDMFIDARRYRYGGPLWLPRLLASLLPPPDLLFLVLDADDDVILSRKPEVAREDLHRLRAAYAQLTTDLPCSWMVRTDQGLEQSLADAAQTIAQYLVERFESRHASWLAVEEASALRQGSTSEPGGPL